MADLMILDTIVIAVVLGIAAQLLAERVRIPAILPLLVFGILAGPNLWSMLGYEDGGLFDPQSLGAGLEIFIHLGIAIILFEGGLSLNPQQFRRVGAAVRNLLTLGVLITGVGAAWLVQAVTGIPWSTAALFGAIVTVTGPTVIQPLLRHMIVPRKVSTILMSEGLIVDPIGAVLAYLVLQFIERPGMEFTALAQELVWLAFIGSVLGFVAGSVAKWVVRSRATGGELRNLSILAILLLFYMIAEHLGHQSGILLAVVMGFTMSAADIPDLVQLKSFKGQLTVLLISVLFILLAGQLELGPVVELGLGGVLVVAGLILLVRPLATFLSIWPNQLGLRERLVVGLTAPRGIVAAGVASLAARSLDQAGLAGGAALEGMVYLTIIITVLWATVMALVLPRAMGYTSDPSRRLTVLVGANPLTNVLAEALTARGRAVSIIDSSSRKLEALRERGFTAVRGDARDASSFEAAGAQRDAQVIAVTTNDELNLLVAELVRDEFGIEHPVVALQRPPDELGTVRRAWVDLLGGRAIDVPRWIRAVEGGRCSVLTVELRVDSGQRLREVLENLKDRVIALAHWQDGPNGAVPSFRLSEAGLEGEPTMTLLVSGNELPEELEAFLPDAAEAPVEKEATEIVDDGAADGNGADGDERGEGDDPVDGETDDAGSSDSEPGRGNGR